MNNIFADPKQTPAISAYQSGQQAVQSATYGTMHQFMPQQPNDSDVGYKAYKLAQQAKGMPVLPQSAWLMAYRHQRLLDGGT